jgi:hypothetical protein
MGHNLKALIAKPAALSKLPSGLKNLHVVQLKQNLVMIPLTDKFLQEIETKYPSAKQRILYYPESFSGAVYEFLKSLPDGHKITYIETEYFGGVGGQYACMFWDHKVYLCPHQDHHPINQVLKELEVCPTNDMDEFDSLGLGDYRDTDDFDDTESE